LGQSSDLRGHIFTVYGLFMEAKASRELKLARNARPHSSETAARHYFQALNWYAPWGSSQTAAKELRDLAVKLKEEGRTEAAYQAFLRLRGALYAARSFYVPRKDLLTEANEFLANYLADQKIRFNGGVGDKAALVKYYGDIYNEGPNFSEFFGFLVVLSFLGWVFYFIKIIWVLFPRGEKVPLTRTLSQRKILIFLFVAFYVAWIFAMKAA
jgi:hypothetical protein